MGVESANYLLVPLATREQVTEVLVQVGAARPKGGVSGPYDKWVIREPYWIDIMVGDLAPNAGLGVSLRIALSNPVGAEQGLVELIRILLRDLGGGVRDQYLGRTFRDLFDDAAEEVARSYQTQRARFQDAFGPFEAAVSADEVFAHLRASVTTGCEGESGD